MASPAAGDWSPGKSWDDENERLHLSMAQLQNELLRVEDACRALQAEEDAQWRLPMRGESMPSDSSHRTRGASHSPKPRARRPTCVVEQAVSSRLVEVQGQSGLRDLLAKECRAAEAAKARQELLREELRAANRDAAQLAAGLPELLERRRAEAPPQAKPIFTSEAHKDEGFAMDFSPHDTGLFLSGGNDALILLAEPVPGGWKVDSEPFKMHKSSVEDVQWKKLGAGAKSSFASCSSDGSWKVWDVREKDRKKAAINVRDAHAGSDVNVLSWSPIVGELIVTGADDGSFKIWDTRHVAAGPMANFKWHRQPICSVDWHPTDETVLAVASADDSASLWDMAVEDDAPGRDLPPGADHFPPQLLFLHQGQKEPKELRWHPQLPSVCIVTAASGFNIFKTCNI